MKNIRFKEITFLSYKGKARRINLDNDLIVVVGGNQSGKTSILKSLYYTLGATVHPFPKHWAEGNIISMLKFSIDGVNYKVVRIGNDIYLFNPDNTLNFCESNRTIIANKLGNLLGIHIFFKDVMGKNKSFSIGYMFMPFYIDQDKGWDQPLNSFSGLSGLGSKFSALLYQTGIIDDDFYVYKSKLDEAENKKKGVVDELTGSLKFKKEVMKRFSMYNQLPFTEDDFNKGISNVLDNLSRLKEKQKTLLIELEKLYSIKYSYQFNIDQLKDNIKEINKDFNYALKSETELCCPMCGASVSNDAFARFKMLDDRDRCKDLLVENNTKLDDIKEKIEEKEQLSSDIKNEIEALQETINRRSEQVSVKEMFESKLKEYVEEIVNDTTSKLFNEQARLERIIEDCKSRIKFLQKNDKKTMVEHDFDNYVKNALQKFGITGDLNKKYTIGSRIKTTGSNIVKNVIAYTYGYLYIMQKYCGPLFAPIVIDEPKQKGIDDNGFISIINSIINDRPKDSQLILSLTDSEFSFIDIDVEPVYLQSGEEVLKSDEFDSVKSEIESYIYGQGFRLR